jgi:hypothetical protein
VFEEGLEEGSAILVRGLAHRVSFWAGWGVIGEGCRCKGEEGRGGALLLTGTFLMQQKGGV